MEMVFTGRPFTAAEMAELGFVNSVVPRDQLEAEVAEVRVGLRAEPLDRRDLHAEDVLRGHEAARRASTWAASSAACSSRWPATAGPTSSETDSTDEAIDKGLSKAVKDFDSRFPPEWRLSKQGPRGHRMSRADRLPRRRPVDRDRRRLLHEAPRRRRRRGRQGRAARGRPAAPVVGLGRAIPTATTARCSRSCRRSRAWSSTRRCAASTRVHAAAARRRRGRVVAGSRLDDPVALPPRRSAAPDGHGHHAVRSRRAVEPTGPPPSSRCRRGRAGSSAWAAARPTGRRCSSAGRSASGSPARTRRSARWCRWPGRRRRRRARRRVDARGARAVPHLLPGDVRRHGGPAVPHRPVASSRPAWRRRATGSSASASAPASSGSTSA